MTTRTLSNWLQRQKQQDLAPKMHGSSPSKIDNEKLKKYIEAHPDSYLREIAEAFSTTLQAIFYACKRLKITLKKRQRTIKKETKKKEKKYLQELEKIPEENRVYIDESGINERLRRKHARSIRGVKAFSRKLYCRKNWI